MNSSLFQYVSISYGLYDINLNSSPLNVHRSYQSIFSIPVDKINYMITKIAPLHKKLKEGELKFLFP